MAYARFFDSDMYIYSHVAGYVYCCACLLNPTGESYVITNDLDLAEHLSKHEAAGHRMPHNLLQDILSDMDRYTLD